MTVRFVDLPRHHQLLRAEIDAAISKVVDRGNFILGEQVAQFEQAFAAYCGVRHAVGVSNGTAALQLLLRAHGIGPGDEVIIPASTFYATAYAIVAVGARPVLVDCELETANLAEGAVRAALTSATRAVLVVHLYGRLTNMPPLRRLCDQHGLLLLEDACQAHGAASEGRRAGAFGDGAAFSFYPGKNLGAFGDGGMVVTDSDEIHDKLMLLRDLGQSEKYHHALLGGNDRLDTIHAAVLLVKLRHLDRWNNERVAAAARYAQLLANLGLELPAPHNPGEHVFHLYVVRHPDRDRIRAVLTSRQIETGLHYPIPLHQLEALRFLGVQEGELPVAERRSREVLSLPIFPEITEAEQQLVAATIRECL